MTPLRHRDRIPALLDELGPALSSAVAARLASDLKITSAYARKTIERAPIEVRRLRKISFPNGENFLYLPDQYKSERFWVGLDRAFTATHSAYGLAVEGFVARGGTLPASYFRIASGSPDRLRGHLSCDTVLRQSLELGLLTESTSSDGTQYLSLTEGGPWTVSDVAETRARVLTESFLLSAIQTWAGRLCLGSHDSFAVRSSDSRPKFGPFDWDLTAPSYIHPLMTVRKGEIASPGFLVSDVILGRTLERSQVLGFLNKVTVMRNLRNTSRFLAILVANRYSPDAFALGRRQGVVFATPDMLFGAGVGKALDDMIGLLSNVAKAVVEHPEVVSELFRRLGEIEGAAGNLRGALFEAFLAYILRNDGAVRIGVPAVNPETGERADIDVLVKKRTRSRAIECKAHLLHSPKDEYVRDWVEKKVPTMRKTLLQDPEIRDKKMSFELWTTSSFSPESVRFLTERKSLTSKYELCWKDGDGVREYFTEAREPRILEVMNEHFFRHPAKRPIAEGVIRGRFGKRVARPGSSRRAASDTEPKAGQ